MTPKLSQLFVSAVCCFTLIAPSVSLRAQSVSSLRSTPNEVEKSDPRVAQIITRAENHFKQGQLNLTDNKREQARDEFDRAVDVILESGMDVRSSPRLRDYYLQLVERIYREEVPTQTTNTPVLLAQNNAPQGQVNPLQVPQPAVAQIGFRQQKFEPSPLDELSRLELTPEEKKVTEDDVKELEVAKSKLNFGFNTNPLIQQFINYYQGRGRATMMNGLSRSGRYMNMARKIFREEGVPEDIVWLGQVESAWRPNAYSHAAASGLWQFIPGTGARFGLRQTAWVDERNSFEKATRASARYLKWLNTRYNGNWELAIGAYNTGEGNIDRAIRRVGSADFWHIYPYIHPETRNYVPNILATILIAKNPERYGFPNVRPEPALAYDTVSVPTATSLKLVAEATDSSVDYLRSINPELRRDVTPRGEAYVLRVPSGRAKQFVAVLNRVPAHLRDAPTRIIQAAPGEDLAAIAARTGASLATLQQWNAGVNLKAGGKVVAPAGGTQNVAMIRRATPNQAAFAGRSLSTVRAQAGDTIAKIAARYGVSASEVAGLNGFQVDAPLARNQAVKIPAQTNGAPSAVATPQSSRRRSSR